MSKVLKGVGKAVLDYQDQKYDRRLRFPKLSSTQKEKIERKKQIINLLGKIIK